MPSSPIASVSSARTCVTSGTCAPSGPSANGDANVTEPHERLESVMYLSIIPAAPLTVPAWTSSEASPAPYRLLRPRHGGRPHWSRPRAHPRYQRTLRLARSTAPATSGRAR